jgi:hydrogenase maturation factor
VSESPPVVAGRLRELRQQGASRVGRVSVRGAEIEVVLDLVPEARAGDAVLVHAGVALSLLREQREADDGRRGEGGD